VSTAPAPYLLERARRAIIVLWLAVAVNALTIPADVFGLVAVDRGLEATTEAQVVTADDLLAASDLVDVVAGVAYLAVTIGGAVAFLMWFHRGHRLLREAGHVTRYTPAWAVGSWFVPFVNLVVPKRAANDLWRAGAHDRVPGLLHWWWAMWLIAGFVGNAVGRAFLDIETLEDYQPAYAVDIVASVLYVVAALLAIAVVRRTTPRLEAAAAEGPPS